MKSHIFFVLLISSLVKSKPLESSRDSQVDNEIDYKKGEKISTIAKNWGTRMERAEISTKQSKNDAVVETKENGEVKSEENGGTTNQQYNPFPNLLLPFLQRLQFSPQTFIQDRLTQLKDSLLNLGIVVPGNNTTTSKQLSTTNGLFNLIGLNDSGFYTNRLEPAGFLGGNGWFANKGGILGGPGAIYSTGSLLTDYPTPYKK